MFDLILRNGSIIDGSGAPPFPGDLAIKDGKIACIAPRLNTDAARILDASGVVVTPGFIDIHRHADARVLVDGFGEEELRQGITTIINGNCGLSAVPSSVEHREALFQYLRPITGPIPRSMPGCFSDYKALLEARGLPLHVGMLAGSGSLRIAANGFTAESLDRRSMDHIHYSLQEAMENGIYGVSLGLGYMPDAAYDVAELARALAPIAGTGLPVITHMRGEGDLLPAAVEEVLEVARRLDAPLHISHFKCVGKRNWGLRLRQAADLIAAAQSAGQRVTVDVYPWVAGSSQLVQILPPEFLEGGLRQVVGRLRNSGERERCRAILSAPQTGFENQIELIGWENIVVSSVRTEVNQRYVGKSMAVIARLLNLDPFDAACELLIQEDGDVAMINFIACEGDVEEILRYPFSCIVSDSLYGDGGLPHPRRYGTFPRVIEEYVQKRGVIPLNEAVHKMTGKPAEILSIAGKGLLREGYDADIAVFAPEDIHTAADYSAPVQMGTGFRYVLVGGKVAVDRDVILPVRAGKYLAQAKGTAQSM